MPSRSKAVIPMGSKRFSLSNNSVQFLVDNALGKIAIAMYKCPPT
ncbi:hypothetical protein [Pedobacter sp. UBA4863]|nr:hypothetical protein [Pedobacter sp. UBA4863]